jgi:hypothetical protein
VPFPEGLLAKTKYQLDSCALRERKARIHGTFASGRLFSSVQGAITLTYGCADRTNNCRLPCRVSVRLCRC